MDTLTPSQKEQVKECARDEASKVLSRYRRQALAGFTALLIGIGGAFWTSNEAAQTSRHNIVQSGNAVAVTGCNRDFVQISKFNAAVEGGKGDAKESLARGEITSAEYKRRIKATDEFLRDNPPPDCRRVRHVITADAHAKIPTPRYPGDHQPKKKKATKAADRNERKQNKR